jgi:uncharacterized protein
LSSNEDNLTTSNINRRTFLKLGAASGIVAGGTLALFNCPIGLNPSNLVIDRKDLRLPSIPYEFDGVKIALISDVHMGSTGVEPDLIEHLLTTIENEQPDLLLLDGDLVTSWAALDNLTEFLKQVAQVKTPMGTFAVLGNHEFHHSLLELEDRFTRAGIRLLRNETIPLQRNGAEMPLVGLDNHFNQEEGFVRELIQDIARLPSPIVLEHGPDLAPMLSKDFDGALLCGHTHGGQIILPVIGQVFTASRYGTRYVKGLYPVGRGTMYITSGVGAVILPIRIGVPPELSILTLRSTKRLAV